MRDNVARAFCVGLIAVALFVGTMLLHILLERVAAQIEKLEARVEILERVNRLAFSEDEGDVYVFEEPQQDVV